MPPIEDVMTQNPVSIMEGTTLSVVLETMRSGDQKYTALVVTDGVGHFTGLITGDEVIAAIESKGKAWKNSPVQEHMLQFPPVVTKTEPLDRVAHLINTYHLHHVVVVENRFPVGIVSIGNMLDYYHNHGFG